MLAGGIGTVRPQHAKKDPDLVEPGAYIIVMGVFFNRTAYLVEHTMIQNISRFMIVVRPSNS